MDVHFFLQERLTFLRQLYAQATAPYVERQRKIRAGEAPYLPKYTQDGDQPYEVEWMEAEDSIQALGKACLSMLSAVLKAYFMTIEQIYSRRAGAKMGPEVLAEFKRGWLAGYAAHFKRVAGIDIGESGLDLSLLEELILLRNEVQHQTQITSENVFVSDDYLRKRPRPFFLEDSVVASTSAIEPGPQWLMAPAIRVTPERYEKVLSTVMDLDAWLESRGILERAYA